MNVGGEGSKYSNKFYSKVRRHFFSLRPSPSLKGPLRNHIATTFGVTRCSILNSLQYFHVIEGLVPDIMHDLLEGSLPLLTKLLLTYFIREKHLFSLAYLNERIASFKYGSAVKVKPSTISPSSFNSEGKLRQSVKLLYVRLLVLPCNLDEIHCFLCFLASQMWCLARFLPLMIGDLIPTDDDHWENYLDMLQIVDYIFAPTTTAKRIAHLEVLIEDFLTEFSQLYDRPLIPKMHYLVHIPYWMTL